MNSYGTKKHLKRCRQHAKERAEQRTGITLNRKSLRHMVGAIKAGKGLRLDSRCSTDPNRSLYWLEVDGKWVLLVYWPLKEEIVTILPTRSRYPYSPIDLKKFTSEAMWANHEKDKIKK